MFSLSKIIQFFHVQFKQTYANKFTSHYVYIMNAQTQPRSQGFLVQESPGPGRPRDPKLFGQFYCALCICLIISYA
jgi:hypothetical protein